VATSALWPVLQALVAGAALFFAWRHRGELRLGPLLVLALGFHVGWVAVHLGVGVPADYDPRVVYAPQGNALLDGEYPQSQYPPGAVLLFAVDVLLGGGGARVSNAFVMIPFQLATVAAVWAIRTEWSRWFAAVIALWPLNAFFWEFRFDLAPTAFLVAGLVLALRRHWALSGAVLGIGAAVKWSPALAAATLALWLLTHRQVRSGVRHGLAFVAAFLAVNLPFLLWAPGKVLDAYGTQGGRGITGESLPFIPLHLVGAAHVEGEFHDPAVVDSWANGAAVAAQIVLLLALAALVVWRARTLTVAVAFAGLMPVVFLISNRIFSPQFLVVLLGAWAVAGSLLARTRWDALLLGGLALAATLANVLVYPTQSQDWFRFSAVLFLCALGATAWVVARGVAVRDPL